MRTPLVLLFGLLAFMPPAKAQVIVTDGDTIKVDGKTYRLWGIDAPEAKQLCADYPAGSRATTALVGLVEGKSVTCEARDRDRYGRTVALCRANGEDVGKAMVRQGMAWAFTRYSSDYVEDERQAIAARIGLHAHQCEKAWDWRARIR